jgi:hypothetical protein
MLRRCGQTQQLEKPVTALPNVTKELPLSVTMDFTPCKRCTDRRKLLIKRSDLTALSVMFPNSVPLSKQSNSEIL